MDVLIGHREPGSLLSYMLLELSRFFQQPQQEMTDFGILDLIEGRNRLI